MTVPSRQTKVTQEKESSKNHTPRAKTRALNYLKYFQHPSSFCGLRQAFSSVLISQKVWKSGYIQRNTKQVSEDCSEAHLLA